jgi:outer membrane protein assembly factor BamB
MLAANGRLFVVTLEGSVYCFGDRRAGGHMLTESRPAGTASSPPGVAVEAEAMIGASGATNGFAAVLGLEDGALLADLARRSAMRVVGVDSDPAVVARLRRRFDDEGLYGERVHLVHGDPFKVSLPPYFADLVVSEKTPRLAAGDAATALFRILRPYGGVICLRSGSRESSDLAAAIAAAFPGEAVVREKKSLLLVSRPGGLPGAGSWTHENADAAGTVNSGDRLVKPPLGILWFGGPSNDRVLPRHGHGPAPEVIGGRLLIEGCDMIRAVDVYTGRLLWEREIKDIGLFFETIHHRPGATEIGGNFAAAEDGVYVMQPDSCLWLDAHSGATRASFKPPKTGVSARTKWGSIRVLDGLLVATADPVNIPIEGVNRPFPWVRPSATPRTDSRRRPAKGIESVEGVDAAADHATGSRMLVVLDRHTGRILWSMRSEQVFRHNAIAAGNGRIFVMDRFSGAQADYLRKRGYEPGEGEGLHALDARTGRVLWTARNGLFGTWLSYSAEHDVLLEATSQHRDCAPDETGEGMRVYAAGDGGILWEKKSRLYDGPCILVGDRIIAKGKAYSLPTGEQIMRPHPLTGEKVPWNFQKAYGCSTAVGSELMLTFRSAAAGFFDLAGAWGTGNLGGFRSGCTPNLIPADGVLNAPDYTRTCTCAYQNQTSLALIHMPGVEVWTFGDVPGYGASSSRIIHAGVNFGAPGDRMADDGTLWLACPNPGFPSPRMKIEVAGSPVYFSRHSSTVAGALPWVSGSWLEGDSIITLGLRLLPTPSDTDIQAGPEAPMPSPSGETLDEKRYTVRLYFSEPSSGRPGERVFDVALQNDTVLTGYDIAKDAGGPARGVYREFSGVLAGDELKIGLKGRVGKPLLCGVSLRVEE